MFFLCLWKEKCVLKRNKKDEHGLYTSFLLKVFFDITPFSGLKTQIKRNKSQIFCLFTLFEVCAMNAP